MKIFRGRGRGEEVGKNNVVRRNKVHRDFDSSFTGESQAFVQLGSPILNTCIMVYSTHYKKFIAF